jgi:hypothetical protein
VRCDGRMGEGMRTTAGAGIVLGKRTCAWEDASIRWVLSHTLTRIGLFCLEAGFFDDVVSVSCGNEVLTA